MPDDFAALRQKKVSVGMQHNRYSPMSDHELMLEVRKSDADAFAELFHRYEKRLRWFFHVLCRDIPLAEDLAQETFLRIWRSRESYQPTGRVEGYLYEIARNLWLNHKRDQSRRPRTEEGAGESVLERVAAEAASQPEHVVLERERRRRIEAAIGELPESLRIVFVLSHFQGMKYREIGEALIIPEGTVKYRMHEAVMRLRETLKDWEV
ncbi:MAG: RNA polymerase sigma factor [Armatimonadetes bacterium]|nr:RNA polymerase sigma factor [Armatimonadota bacterium]